MQLGPCRTAHWEISSCLPPLVRGQMKIIKLSELEKNPGRYGEVAEVLASDGLVVFPGESSYRLGANVLSPKAVARLQQGKRMVQKRPALVFIHREDALHGLVKDVPDVARRLMAAFWPGPLTIRFEPGDNLPGKVRKALSRANGRIGVRVPDTQVCAHVVSSFGGPLLVSSANRSERAGAQSLALVRKTFGNVADLIIDAGDLPPGDSSTVVDVSDKGWKIVREGGLSADQIASRTGLGPA